MVNDFADQPRNSAWMSGVAMLANACAGLGDVERSRTLYDLLAPFQDRNVLAADCACWGAASHYLGMLAATRGEYSLAQEHFEHALAMNERMGASPWVAHTCHQYALMLLDRDRSTQIAPRSYSGVLSRLPRNVGCTIWWDSPAR
jgi:hypothetical protein